MKRRRSLMLKLAGLPETKRHDLKEQVAILGADCLLPDFVARGQAAQKAVDDLVIPPELRRVEEATKPGKPGPKLLSDMINKPFIDARKRSGWRRWTRSAGAARCSASPTCRSPARMRSRQSGGKNETEAHPQRPQVRSQGGARGASPSPSSNTPTLKVVRPPPAGMEAIWLPLRNNWLRVVMDNRVGAGRRIFRIELYDKDQTERLAVFRRQTEAMRR